MKFLKLLKEAQFHGSKRLADRKNRWQWCFALLLLFCVASTVVVLLVERYLQNPIFMGHFHRMQFKVPFPMVAICPEIIYPNHRIDNFLNTVKLPPGIDANVVKMVINQLSAFYAPDVNFNLNDVEIVEAVLEYNDLTVEKAGSMLSSSCEETLQRCSWSGRITECSKLFQLEMTRYGFCCVFNGNSLRRSWGLIPKSKLWSSQNVGSFSGITVVVNQSQHIDDVNLTYKWLLVQDQNYFGDTTVNGSAVSPGSEQWLIFSRRGYQVSEETRGLSNSLRKCRLASEPLKFFPVYNRKHCLMECEMAQMLDICECIGVTYPPLPNVPICKANKIFCMKTVALSWSDNQCNCPEACETDIGSYVIDSHKLVASSPTFDSIYSGLDCNKTSVVRVYNAGHGKLMLDKKSIFGLYDLYSQLGGIFTAFYGCSVLTLLEILQLIWFRFQRY